MTVIDMQYKLKPVLLFALAGVLSGITCWAGTYVLPENQSFNQYYPGIVLGIFLFLSGRYIAHTTTGKNYISLIILILWSILGWRISIELGYEAGGPAPFVNAGALGAFTVAWGWLLAWKKRQHLLVFTVVVTFAGALGGLVFQIIDNTTSIDDNLWVFILFTEWQVILMAAIALAHPAAEVKP